jgi:hypothetical protein
MAHLPLLIGSLAIEENGPQIKPFAYIRISENFSCQVSMNILLWKKRTVLLLGRLLENSGDGAG